VWDPDQSSWLATTFAPEAVIEGQDGKASGLEPGCVLIEAHFPGPAQTMRHHDARSRDRAIFWQVQPALDYRPIDLKSHIQS